MFDAFKNTSNTTRVLMVVGGAAAIVGIAYGLGKLFPGVELTDEVVADLANSAMETAAEATESVVK